MAKDVIVALDFPGKAELIAFLDHFSDPIYVKVGMELFYAQGPDIIREIKSRGHEIFLDLKFHDIPNTVAGAVRSTRQLGVAMSNLHAGGGLEMMKAAKAALADSSALLIAVTQLTSTSQQVMTEEILIPAPLQEVVLGYAGLAKQAGLDGVVCSALEVPLIKETFGSNFLTVTPGIRPASAAKGDQKRVVTPAMARSLGSDYIVVGRPITQAKDPKRAYDAIYREFMGLA